MNGESTTIEPRNRRSVREVGPSVTINSNIINGKYNGIKKNRPNKIRKIPPSMLKISGEEEPDSGLLIVLWINLILFYQYPGI
jgi:hypothetical protein